MSHAKPASAQELGSARTDGKRSTKPVVPSEEPRPSTGARWTDEKLAVKSAVASDSSPSSSRDRPKDVKLVVKPAVTSDESLLSPAVIRKDRKPAAQSTRTVGKSLHLSDFLLTNEKPSAAAGSGQTDAAMSVRGETSTEESRLTVDKSTSSPKARPKDAKPAVRIRGSAGRTVLRQAAERAVDLLLEHPMHSAGTLAAAAAHCNNVTAHMRRSARRQLFAAAMMERRLVSEVQNFLPDEITGNAAIATICSLKQWVGAHQQRPLF